MRCLLEEFIGPSFKYGRVDTSGVPVIEVTIRQRIVHDLGNSIYKAEVVRFLARHHYHRPV